MEYNNEEIVTGIYERDKKVISFLYADYMPMIKKFTLKNYGTEEEAKDLFQDTVIIVFEKINSGDLKLSSSFKTYFYAICKNLWKQRLHIRQKISNQERTEDAWNNILGYDEYQEFEEEKLFHYHFSKLDEDCREVLTSFFDKRPFRKIANDLKFSPSYIKKLKFKCKEKLIRNIINDPVYHELMELKLKNQLNGKSVKISSKNGRNIQFNKDHENKK